jgi:hypothetical protein
LLGFRTRRVEAGDEAFTIDADTFVPTLEVELTAEWRRVGFVFQRVQTKAVVRTGRA